MSAEECTACGVRTDWTNPPTLTEYTGLMDGTVALCDDCRTDDPSVLHLIANLGPCCLHIVVDDHNTGDDSVRFVLDYANERGHTFCAWFATELLAMSEAGRRHLLGCEAE